MLGSYVVVISEHEVHFREVLTIHRFNRLPHVLQTCRKHSEKSIRAPAWSKGPLSCSAGPDGAFFLSLFSPCSSLNQLMGFADRYLSARTCLPWSWENINLYSWLQ